MTPTPATMAQDGGLVLDRVGDTRVLRCPVDGCSFVVPVTDLGEFVHAGVSEDEVRTHAVSHTPAGYLRTIARLQRWGTEATAAAGEQRERAARQSILAEERASLLSEARAENDRRKDTLRAVGVCSWCNGTDAECLAARLKCCPDCEHDRRTSTAKPVIASAVSAAYLADADSAGWAATAEHAAHHAAARRDERDAARAELERVTGLYGAVRAELASFVEHRDRIRDEWDRLSDILAVIGICSRCLGTRGYCAAVAPCCPACDHRQPPASSSPPDDVVRLDGGPGAPDVVPLCCALAALDASDTTSTSHAELAAFLADAEAHHVDHA